MNRTLLALTLAIGAGACTGTEAPPEAGAGAGPSQRESVRVEPEEPSSRPSSATERRDLEAAYRSLSGALEFLRTQTERTFSDENEADRPDRNPRIGLIPVTGNPSFQPIPLAASETTWAMAPLRSPTRQDMASGGTREDWPADWTPDMFESLPPGFSDRPPPGWRPEVIEGPTAPDAE